MNKKLLIIAFAFLGISQVSFAQIKDERLILDKKREPEVKKIEKKKTSVETTKDYPPKEKKIQDSLNLKYDITDVPAVSDFKTSTIQGEDISPKFNADYQNNYVRFGLGNYSKILADANISTILENKMEVGADVHYLSTQGLKKKYDWDSSSSNAEVAAFLNGYGDKGKFNLLAEYEANDYNYYGIYALIPDADVDLQQKTNEFRINGYYDFYSNEILNDIRVKSSFLSDTYKSKETAASVLLNLSKHAVELNNDFTLNGDLGVGLESQRTDFSLLNENSSNYFNATLSPKVTIFKGQSYLMLGSDFSFLRGKANNTSLTEEVKANKTYWFPRAEALYYAMDEFKFYAGVDGGLKLNSYASLLEENPFIVSDQMLKPTDTKYHFYFGMKGDISESLKYNISAGFAKIDDIAFFAGNDLFDYNNTLNRSAYNYANTFSVVYDNGTVNNIKGSVQYFPIQNLAIDAEINFAKYNLDNYYRIYNKPLVTSSIGAKYTMLDKKLLLGFKGMFGTDKTTNSFTISDSTVDPSAFVSVENTDDKVGGFADLNLSAEYKIHKNFSIFALGNNLLNANYQTYNGYNVLGAQILGGVKISF